MYRYIALLDGCAPRESHARLDHLLRQLELPHRLNLGRIHLYVAENTPVVSLASGDVVIGHLFARSTSAPASDRGLNGLPSADRLPPVLLKDFWGEYLLLQTCVDGVSAMRDPSGGVDCVYSLRDGFITSDISIAVQLGLYSRKIDWSFIRGNLIYPHHKAGRTGLADLHELLPGCQLNLANSQHSIEQVWSPWPFVSAPHRHTDPHQAATEVRDAVSSTVKRWAETDQSLLLELSGGLDSSIVAACLQNTTARVSCSNLVTPVPGADERKYASLMADLLGVELHVDHLGFTRTPLDFEPPPNTVAPSTWFLQHAANELSEAIATQLGVKSFFSGGGGDTVFCFTRTAAPAADAFREHGLMAALRAIRDLAELHQCTVWNACRLTVKKLRATPKPPRKPDTSFLSPMLANEVLENHPWFAAPEDALPGDRERIFDLAGTQVFRDGLARGTRRHLRMPLLSQPVLEACLKVPSWMWIAEGRNRAVARSAFSDLLPPDILHRRSKGTFMNYSGAVYRRNKRLLEEYLLTGQLADKGFLDADVLRQFFSRDPAARDDRFMRIFDLCAAESWVRHQH